MINPRFTAMALGRGMFDFAPPALDCHIPLQQAPVFGRAMTRLGVDMTRHVLPGGTAQVLMRRIRGLGPVGVVSRGPVWTDPAGPIRVDGLRDMRQALGLRHLFVSPEAEEDADVFRAAGFLRVAAPASVAMLRLTGTPGDWRQRMHPKWRNRLRHAEKQGLVVERHDLAPRADHWLLRADHAQQAQRRYRNLPHAVLREIARAELGAAQLFLARAGRVRIAAMLFLRHGATASYHIGWTSPEGQARSAHNLLLWTAMAALAARGHLAIDLGLLNPRRTPGIDRFKSGAGAEMLSLGGTWLQSAWTMPLHRRLAPKRA